MPACMQAVKMVKSGLFFQDFTMRKAFAGAL
jgi:hypothetical protein